MSKEVEALFARSDRALQEWLKTQTFNELTSAACGLAWYKALSWWYNEQMGESDERKSDGGTGTVGVPDSDAS